jgi:hypothetical protein
MVSILRRFAVRCSIVLLAAGLSPVAKAAAQAPPMGMGWAIESQMRNQAIGDAMAQQAAMTYYNMMLNYRRTTGDWTTKFAPPVSAAQLQQSIQGANAAAQRYIQGSQINSNRTHEAINNYDIRAIRGQNEVYIPGTGTVQRVDNGYANYYLGAYGGVYGTNGPVPNGATPLKTRW